MKNSYPFKVVLCMLLIGAFIFTSCRRDNSNLLSNGNGSDTVLVDSSTSPLPDMAIHPEKGEENRIITVKTKNFDESFSDFKILLGEKQVDILSDSADELTFQVPEGTEPGSYEVTLSAETDTGTVTFSLPFAVVPYNSTGKHKVLLFGIDGLQYEKIADANTPHMDKLYSTKAYTGGIDGTGIEQATWSGAGWMTVLNGTWVDKHTVNGNDVNTYSDQSKSIFTYIRENKPNAYMSSLVTWQPIHTLQGTQMNNVDYKWYGNWSMGNGIDAVGVDKAESEILNHGPDFIFDYVVNVDDLAHQLGFGPDYQEAIETADEQLGQLMDAIKKRKETHDENWLIMVVTDHGRYADGHSHGGQEEGTKTIFIKMNKEGNEYFKTHNTDIPNHQYNDLYGYPQQAAVTPTILRFLGIDLQDDWGFAAPPVLGEDGPRNLMFADEVHKELYWTSSSSNQAVIYKNGEKIDEVAANQGSYVDETNDEDYVDNDGLITYTVSIDGSTAYISTKMMVKPDVHIVGVMTWTDDNTIYPFRNDGMYGKFYMSNHTMSTQYGGYPADITSGAWSQEVADNKDKINAIVRWGSNVFLFLNDGTYIKYSVTGDSFVSHPDINENAWPGLPDYSDKIRAGIEWTDDNLYFFLNDGTYLQYKKSGPEGVVNGYPKNTADDWDGITEEQAEKISSAFIDPSDTDYAYFFLNDNTYIKYDVNADKALSGYPKPLTDGNWPLLLAY